jgi:hypothetical protein
MTSDKPSAFGRQLSAITIPIQASIFFNPARLNRRKLKADSPVLTTPMIEPSRRFRAGRAGLV